MSVPPSALPISLTSSTGDRLGPGDPLGHAERALEDRLRVGQDRSTRRLKAPTEATPVATAPMDWNASADCSQQADAVGHDPLGEPAGGLDAPAAVGGGGR